MTSVDLNCDVGEECGDDEALFPLITSANIACGAHAGSPEAMRASVRLAVRFGVAIGAHPGFRDREHFGRVSRPIAAEDARALVADQVSALAAVAAAEGAILRHVKPHGALYNMAATDAALAGAIARAVRDVDSKLILVGLAGSEMIRAAEALGVTTANEAFADRAYRSDGTLVPRSSPGALVANVTDVARQVVSIVRDGEVRAIDGRAVRVQADTICLHGDGPNAVALALAIRRALEDIGVRLAPLTGGPV